MSSTTAEPGPEVPSGFTIVAPRAKPLPRPGFTDQGREDVGVKGILTFIALAVAAGLAALLVWGLYLSPAGPGAAPTAQTVAPSRFRLPPEALEPPQIGRAHV